MVVELLLGDNPFIGVSHLAQDKALEEAKEASLERRAEVLRAAREAGATGFTFSTHESNLELLRFLASHDRGLLESLNYYILVPYAYAYVRRATSLGMAGLVRDVLSRILGRGVFSGIRAILSLDYEELAARFIVSEVAPYLEVLPRSRVRAVLLHEVATELIIAFNASGLLRKLGENVRRLGLGFGIETRNMGIAAAWLERNNISLDYVMTPVNAAGYQMAPSKEEAEEAIARLSRATRIIGINILASGALGIDTAIEYLEGLSDKLYAVAVGTSKPWRARENFQKLRRLLKTAGAVDGKA